ncbi:hypothetical protein Sjap_010970 [Stephania japonica]|uniref:Uncharacterized protein n=1 Tax=Stephania japonica TaxID=461633 RepID=A0AAP0JAK9_9MAGN
MIRSITPKAPDLSPRIFERVCHVHNFWREPFVAELLFEQCSNRELIFWNSIDGTRYGW